MEEQLFETVRLRPGEDESRVFDAYLNEGWVIHRVVEQPLTSNVYVIFERKE